MKKLSIIPLFLLLTPAFAYAIPIVDSAAGVGAQTTTTPATLIFNNTAGDSMIVGIAFNHAADPTSVTFAGVAMTKVVSKVFSPDDESYWSLNEPSQGANKQLKVSWTSGTVDMLARATFFRDAVAVIARSDITHMAAAGTSLSFTATSSFATSRLYTIQGSTVNGTSAQSVTGANQLLDSTSALNNIGIFTSHTAPVVVGTNTLGYSWTTSASFNGVWVEVLPLFELWPLQEF